MPIPNKPENIERFPDRYVTCECGLVILKGNFNRHVQRAKRHAKWLETQHVDEPKVEIYGSPIYCGEDDGDCPCVKTKETYQHEKCHICDGYYDNNGNDDFVELDDDDKHPCEKCGEITDKMIRWKHNGDFECQGECGEESDDEAPPPYEN